MNEKNPKITLDNKREENIIQKINKNSTFKLILLIFIVCALGGGIIYYQVLQSRIYVEKSEIDAPIISISSPTPGILEKIRVSEGERVGKGTIVAIVGNLPIKTMTDGIIIETKNTPGQSVTSSDSLVKMFDPSELRVIGHVDEDKGLKDIKPGQEVIFTVDAFGSKKYNGIVDTIIPSSRQSSVVFSISDKREQKQFDVKVKFDVATYPELKNGMSAKMWIYK